MSAVYVMLVVFTNILFLRCHLVVGSLLQRNLELMTKTLTPTIQNRRGRGSYLTLSSFVRVAQDSQEHLLFLLVWQSVLNHRLSANQTIDSTRNQARALA